MALSTTPIDLNRGSSGITLPSILANDVIAAAQEQSAVMKLAPQVTLPGAGLTIPVVLGDATAAWTAETAEKYVGVPTVETKVMHPYKLTLIEAFSNELRRDMPALYDELRRRLPGAIAKKFDETVFYGTAPGTGFDTLAASPAITEVPGTKDIFECLVEAKSSVATQGGFLNGWAISPQGEAAVIGAVDQSGRPLFINGIGDGSVSRILGADAVMARAAYKASNGSIVAGDWSMARWGIVNDIQISLSDQATINDGTNIINLWQRNMFALRIEAELGFVCADDDYFVRVITA